MIYTDPTGHKWYHAVSGFLDAVANTITAGGYDYVVHKVDAAMGWTQEEPDYYAAQSWGYSVAETASAFAAAAGASGTVGGGGACLVTAGGGCVVAAGAAGVTVLAGFEGTFAATMNDKSSDLYNFYSFKDISKKYNWARPHTLKQHYDDHGSQFGAKDPEDYARMAKDFYDNRGAYQTKVDSDGTIRVYDANTNTFGSYYSNGETKTLFKPENGQKYYDGQPGN
ncbi:hypothetical protein [Paenibacillus sp. SI8]|uniref:hypothetical protein n=1 Tax=unclassified Paenibacillus TaxID=185978 RepID=UPI0034660A71